MPARREKEQGFPPLPNRPGTQNSIDRQVHQSLDSVHPNNPRQHRSERSSATEPKRQAIRCKERLQEVPASHPRRKKPTQQAFLHRHRRTSKHRTAPYRAPAPKNHKLGQVMIAFSFVSLDEPQTSKRCAKVLHADSTVSGFMMLCKSVTA